MYDVWFRFSVYNDWSVWGTYVLHRDALRQVRHCRRGGWDARVTQAPGKT